MTTEEKNKPSDSELSMEKRLERQGELLEKIAKEVHIVKRRLLMAAIGSYLRLFILLIPIIFAIIYLPPLIEEFSKQYGGLVDVVGSAAGAPSFPRDFIEDAVSDMDSAQVQAIIQSFGRQE